jgi:hypothetical protein
MALLDRFRPKPEWQHPDALIRADAVRRMDSRERDTLEAIAREDPDARVRRAAVKKVGPASVLGAIAREDRDEGVREEAAGVLAGLAIHERDAPAGAEAVAALDDPRHLAAVAKSALLESTRRAALGRLGDAKALGGVVREAQDPAIRLEAVARIQDPAVLAAIALNGEHKASALAAVERVADGEALNAIAARAKVGAVARRARARLESLAPPPPSPPPEGGVNEEEERRQRERFEEERQREERRQQERAGERGARSALCASLESAGGPDALRILEEARAAWAALPPGAGAENEALGRRFEQAAEACRERHQAWTEAQTLLVRGAELVAEAEGLAQSAALAPARSGLAALQQKWSDLPPPAGAEALQARLDQAAARLRAREAEAKAEREGRERDNLARLEALCARCEGLAQAERLTLKEADGASREAKQALEDPGPLPSRRDRETVTARLGFVRKALYRRLQQLREDEQWKRWANLGVQEELAGRAEALRAEADLEAAAKALHELDARWKQAAQAPKEKGEALWARFKTARDEVKARCDAYFARLAEEQAENLARKEALCARAEALAESTDWLKTAEEIKALQAEWKAIGPVPRTRAKALWERFRKPCDRFFTRRQENREQRSREWGANLERKEALCARVEALAESTDWEKTAADVRQLQAQWKAIGPVRKNKSEAVWARFRGAADHFFERYKHREELERAAGLAAREVLCAELEALAAAEAPPADLGARVQAAQVAWRQGVPAPPEALASLSARFAEARDRLVLAHPKSFEGTDLDPEANLRKMEKLCARLERLLAESELAGGDASGPDLAQRLRNALASNTIGGHAAVEAKWQAAQQEVESAQAAWRRLGPLPGEAGLTLRGRFEEACRSFFARRPAPAPRRTPPEPARSRPRS